MPTPLKVPAPAPRPVLFGPDYLSLPRPDTPWLIHSLLPKDGMLLLYSAPKQGKSTALLQLASSIATPEQGHFLGLPIMEHGPTGYLQLDTPSGLWAGMYVEPMNDQLNFSQVAFEDRDTMQATNPGLYPFNILKADHWQWLRNWIDAFKPKAVIIDTYRELFRGEERDSDLGQRVIAELYRACTPAAIILVHHARKIDPKNPSEHVSEDARGSTYLTGKVDVICQFSRKRWKIQGRGSDMLLKTKRDAETGLIHLDGAPLALISAVLNDQSYSSDRMRAAYLAEQLGISVEAARYRIKEARKHLGGGELET